MSLKILIKTPCMIKKNTSIMLTVSKEKKEGNFHNYSKMQNLHLQYFSKTYKYFFSTNFHNAFM